VHQKFRFILAIALFSFGGYLQNVTATALTLDGEEEKTPRWF